MTSPEPDAAGDRPHRVIDPVRTRPGKVATEYRKKARTSTAAAFALAISSAAAVLTLLAVFFPIAPILGVIGLLLGIVGIRAAKRPDITGRGVCVSAIVLSLFSIVMGVLFAAGVVTVLNDQNAVNRIERQVENLHDRLP